MAMSLLVRLRPNGPYLLFMLAAAVGIWYGVTLASLPGGLVAASCGVVLVLFGYPVMASTIGRVPVFAVGSEGISLPLMGVRLSWPEVSSVKLGTGSGRRASVPVLLIFPADPHAAIGAARPWLRRELRGNLARHGTPIVVSGTSLDHSVDDMAAAVRQYWPVPQA
jgi:hypothetical protein